VAKSLEIDSDNPTKQSSIGASMTYLSCVLFGVAIGWVFGYQTGRHLANTNKNPKDDK
jgi:hypothetical protein